MEIGAGIAFLEVALNNKGAPSVSINQETPFGMLNASEIDSLAHESG